MTITTLNTEHFSDVELAAKDVAETVRGIQNDLATSHVVVSTGWVGEGSKAFEDLYYVVSRQMKDISEEFWKIYEALIDAEENYMEADQEQATKIASGEYFNQDANGAGSGSSSSGTSQNTNGGDNGFGGGGGSSWGGGGSSNVPSTPGGSNDSDTSGSTSGGSTGGGSTDGGSAGGTPTNTRPTEYLNVDQGFQPITDSEYQDDITDHTSGEDDTSPSGYAEQVFPHTPIEPDVTPDPDTTDPSVDVDDPTDDTTTEELPDDTLPGDTTDELPDDTTEEPSDDTSTSDTTEELHDETVPDDTSDDQATETNTDVPGNDGDTDPTENYSWMWPLWPGPGGFVPNPHPGPGVTPFPFPFPPQPHPGPGVFPFPPPQPSDFDQGRIPEGHRPFEWHIVGPGGIKPVPVIQIDFNINDHLMMPLPTGGDSTVAEAMRNMPLEASVSGFEVGTPNGADAMLGQAATGVADGAANIPPVATGDQIDAAAASGEVLGVEGDTAVNTDSQGNVAAGAGGMYSGGVGAVGAKKPSIQNDEASEDEYSTDATAFMAAGGIGAAVSSSGSASQSKSQSKRSK